jgi:hypothetical protein
VEVITARHPAQALIAPVILLFILNARIVGADSGIASHYPGDKNIASDPAVIFADDFESYASPSEIQNKWNNVYHFENIRIATEGGNFFAGSKALEFSLPITTTEVANSLGKRLTPTRDTVFLRAYTKFDPGYSINGSNHNGLRLSANYPGPGIMPPANGTGFFLFLLQNNFGGNLLPGEATPGFSHIYAYWPKQRSSFGDHWYPDGMVKPYDNNIGNQGDWLAFPGQYPDFKLMPNFLPQRNRWYCYELMVRANTPGQNNGEVKYWIDGTVISDFPNLNIRSIDTLKIDEAHIGLHAQHSERVNKKWYDNVVIATQYIGPMASASPVPSPTPTAPAQLQNISSRLLIQTGNNVGIAGFVIGGSEAKKLLIRGLGPTLTQFNVTGVMPNPTLKLYDGSGSLITTNDDWKSTQEAAITATDLAPPNDLEAAILAALQPGAYTVIQADASGAAGVGLLEVYDLDPQASSKLLNLSTRGLVQTDVQALIAGCSVAADSNDVLVRALGPSLRTLGIDNALADPVVTLYDSNANVIAANDDWKDSQRSAVENTGLQPPNDLDAALLIRLARGNYTAIVTGKSGSVGVGLAEVYALP